MPLYILIDLQRDGQLTAWSSTHTDSSGKPSNWSELLASESTVSQVLRSLAKRFAQVRTGSKPLASAEKKEKAS